MIIPKGTFVEMNEDIEVNVLYPNMQVDIFRNERSNSVSYIVSTTFDGKLHYQFYVGNDYSVDKQTEITDDLIVQVKQSVLRTL